MKLLINNCHYLANVWVQLNQNTKGCHFERSEKSSAFHTIKLKRNRSDPPVWDDPIPLCCGADLL